MIAIVNYDTGNICSVTNALKRVGCTDWVYTDDKEILMKADKVILPGVGEASTAMAKLAERGLDAFIPTLTQPVLGICVGTQLMCQSSEEGNVECMGSIHSKDHLFRLLQPEEISCFLPTGINHLRRFHGSFMAATARIAALTHGPQYRLCHLRWLFQRGGTIVKIDHRGTSCQPVPF